MDYSLYSNARVLHKQKLAGACISIASKAPMYTYTRDRESFILEIQSIHPPRSASLSATARARTIDFCRNGEPPSNYVPLTFNGSDIIGFSLLPTFIPGRVMIEGRLSFFFFFSREFVGEARHRKTSIVVFVRMSNRYIYTYTRHTWSSLRHIARERWK